MGIASPLNMSGMTTKYPAFAMLSPSLDFKVSSDCVLGDGASYSLLLTRGTPKISVRYRIAVSVLLFGGYARYVLTILCHYMRSVVAVEFRGWNLLPLMFLNCPVELPSVKTPETQHVVSETPLKRSPGCSNLRGAGS
jgi:hypothetical protein